MSSEKFAPAQERLYVRNRALVDAFVQRQTMTLKLLAGEIGLTPDNFSKVLNGERVIRGDQLLLLARILGCACWQLTNDPRVVCVSSDDHALLSAMITATTLMAEKIRKDHTILPSHE